MEATVETENERIEIRLLLEAIFQKYGHDFRNYVYAHVKRRLDQNRRRAGLENFSAMQHRLIYDRRFFEALLMDLSINVTEMFRDPWFYQKVRESLIPRLKTYPFLRIWHAGCSAGQEVYSMAILFREEGLKDRTQVYATDFNEKVLDKAKDGIYPISLIREYTANYQKAGGTRSFSDYYTADYDSVIMKRFLKEQVLFSSHNLVTDGVFGEMNVIFCRNVLIYFNKELQNRVLSLFFDSLCPGGYLCLGSKESLKFSTVGDKFEVVAEREKIYRKKRY